MLSFSEIRLSAKMYHTHNIAPIKNNTSLKNANRGTLKGEISETVPATNMLINDAAPRSSPIPRPAEFALNAVKVPNRSGAPLPSNIGK